MDDEENLLVDRENYLAHGVHIGTKSQHKDMEDYIFHVKKNKLAILNLNKTDKLLREAAEYIADFNPSEILIVGRNQEAHKPIEAFSENVGTKSVVGRFMPGTLTNPQSENFTEPELVIVANPEEDRQAIKEADLVNTPVIALTDSGNHLDNITKPIPSNNKGEKSIGMVLYLLAKETLKNKGEDPDFELNDFLSQEVQEEKETAEEAEA